VKKPHEHVGSDARLFGGRARAHALRGGEEAATLPRGAVVKRRLVPERGEGVLSRERVCAAEPRGGHLEEVAHEALRAGLRWRAGLWLRLRHDRAPPTEDGAADDSPAGAGMKLAACAVDFNVGFFADRATGFEGISHFLEHMVFMGSEKFPGENHFSDWLSQHWGSENACTDSEQTTFYFECHPKHLKEGLDIFSGYFLSPLLKMDAVEREVTAVESEFERVVNNDSTRVEAIMVRFFSVFLKSSDDCSRSKQSDPTHGVVDSSKQHPPYLPTATSNRRPT
jgi:hypothetical protein